MKNWLWRVSTVAFAAAAGCSIGCSSSGCGGTNVNGNTSSALPTTSAVCGAGTYQSGGQCVGLPTSGSNNYGTSIPAKVKAQ